MLGPTGDTRSMVKSSPATKLGAPFADAPIAKYISKQIDVQQSLGKSQREIATEIGYDKPNMISMFKTGTAKVPLEKIPAIAKALNVDPAFLFKLAIQQYWPNLGEVISEIFGFVLTPNERDLVQLFRDTTKGADPRISRELAQKIRAALKS